MWPLLLETALKDRRRFTGSSNVVWLDVHLKPKGWITPFT
jgi:hypothetical protein